MSDSLEDEDKAVVSLLLPYELILHVFDIAAASSQSTAITLCLVSSWARTVARRRLLHTVALPTERQTDAFLHMLGAQPDPAVDAALVRRLWLLPGRARLVDCMVGHFPNLTDLGITPMGLFYSLWKSDTSRPRLPPPNCDLRLTLIPSPLADWAMHVLTSVQPGSEHPAILASVTHLSFALFQQGPWVRGLLRMVAHAHLQKGKMLA
ncbi:hypothetical protein PLICRDRAFT_180494 [Plicaturopsis crispa FD-325 SS-3]|uniref:F-box domain-containing protein n=1 Tax=Plicaturopsis crispa FD-325 SS-3 TaxID=944288 RepID=A0A0C9SKA9_PLICR|nr:hypothetical protein PLICRDRAFT_180494 [Plicaturopsis crispa FD-325 SS-3]